MLLAEKETDTSIVIVQKLVHVIKRAQDVLSVAFDQTESLFETQIICNTRNQLDAIITELLIEFMKVKTLKSANRVDSNRVEVETVKEKYFANIAK